MPEYTVYYTRVVEIGVKVEAEDPDDAIDKGYDLIPELSAEASGWGQDWTRDENEESEPESVATTDGEFVWTSPERWTRASA